jgi:DNA-binding NarL/FixJ family response regulator
LLRSAPIRELRAAIRQAAAAQLWTTAQLQRAEAYQQNVGRRLAALAPRERQIFWLLAAGLSNREMAARLAVSENTLEKHVGAILRKTELRSRKALLAFVLQHHLDALADPAGAGPGR